MFGSHPVYSHSKVCMQKLTIEKCISMDIQVCARVRGLWRCSSLYQYKPH